MNLPIVIALLLAAAVPQRDTGEPFRLEGGDFRWIPIRVRQVPLEVDCHFQIVKGDKTVHMELLPMSEFRLFDRGQEHDMMASTSDAPEGEFRRVIDTRGQYAVVVQNKRGAAPVSVVLRVQTNLNPDADVAQTLPPNRRLMVIVASFAFFFAALAWSGHKLLKGIRRQS